MYYTYTQNNSGGTFQDDNKVGMYVIVEADSSDQADKFAEGKADIYFDGCDSGMDCSCCGDRWSQQWNDEGSAAPSIDGQPIQEHISNLRFSLRDEYSIHIYHKNEHETVIVDAKNKCEKNKAKKRDMSDKLWGVSFHSSIEITNKPVRYYQSDSLKTYWDKSGNLSIEGVGLKMENSNWGTFASKNKKEVQEFIDAYKSNVKNVLNFLEGTIPDSEDKFERLTHEILFKQIKGRK